MVVGVLVMGADPFTEFSCNKPSSVGSKMRMAQTRWKKNSLPIFFDTLHEAGMPSLLPIPLIIMLSFLTACSPFSNSLNKEILDCGSPLGDRPFFKVLLPDGTDFPASTTVEATVFNHADSATQLEVTSKACVIHSDGKDSTDSFLFVKAQVGTNTYSILRSLRQPLDGALRLRAPTASPFEWSCPIQMATSAQQLALATKTNREDANPYVFEYSLKKDDWISPAVRIFQPLDLALNFSKDGKPLDEGLYHITTKLYDLNESLSFDKPTVEKACELTIDRTAPQELEPEFGKIETALADPAILQLAPSQLIAFRGYGDFTGQIFYCLDPIEESTLQSSKTCDDPKKFLVVGARSFLPSQGLWTLRAYARDAAGNTSVTQAWDLLVIDRFNLEQLKSLFSAVISVAPSDPNKALQFVLSAYTSFKNLATSIERKVLQPLLNRALLASGLTDIAYRISLGETITSLQYNNPGDRLYAIENGRRLVGWERKNWENLELDISGESMTLDVAHDRVYTFNEGAIQILNLNGEELNHITWLQARQPSIQIAYPYVLIFGDKDAIVLKNDLQIRPLMNRRSIWPVAISNLGILRFFDYDTESRSGIESSIDLNEPESTPIEKEILLKNACKDSQNPTLNISSVSYSPNGDFLILSFAGGYLMGVADREGKAVACGLDLYDKIEFSMNGKYLTHVRNRSRMTLATKSTFDYTVWNMDDKQGPKVILETTELEDNVSNVHYVGEQKILFSTLRGKQMLINLEGCVRAETTIESNVRIEVGSTLLDDEIAIAVGRSLYIWSTAQAPAKIPATLVDLPLIADKAFGAHGRVAYRWQNKIYLVEGPNLAPRWIADAPESVTHMEFNASADRLLVSTLPDFQTNETVHVLRLHDGSWQHLGQFSRETFDWFGQGSDVIARPIGKSYQILMEGATGYQQTTSTLCSGHELLGWSSNPQRDKALISCGGGTLKQLAWHADGWMILSETQLESEFSIEAIDASGQRAILYKEGSYFLWKYGFALSRYPTYIKDDAYIMNDGRILSRGLSSSDIMIDENNIIELDVGILAVGYDPESDLIVLAADDQTLQIYSSEGELISKLEFKLIHKQYAPYYAGVTNFKFQEGYLKLDTPSAALFLPLSSERILERACILLRNKNACL